MLQNRYLVIAVLSSLALMFPVLYVDALQPIFKTVPLGLRDWALVLVAAGIPTFLLGAGSVISGSKNKPKRRLTAGGAKPIAS